MRIFFFTAWALVATLFAGCGSSPEKAADASPQQVRTTSRVWVAPPEIRQAKSVSYVGKVGVPTSGLSGDYAGYPAAARLIDKLVREEGFRRADLERVLSWVERQQWILDLVNRPRGKRSQGPTGAWTRYRAKFLTRNNISKGIGFWRRYDKVLRRAQAQYGVPPEYVVAIIGVETRYGGYLGKHRVIDALATLAFDYPRRSKFFTGELESFLIMARDEGLDPFGPKGSYAGAMGLCQFMPSSFRRWAVDFDGNGKRDLWNPVDAIGSVANYFASHGWRKGEPVAVRTSASGAGVGAMKTGFDSTYSLAALRRNGIAVTAGLDGRERVSLIKLDAAGGYEYWLGLENFYVITRYNHSSYYAMAVYQLARALRSRRGPGGPALAWVGVSGYNLAGLDSQAR
ncbi:lytic murein transglycosylase B [Candidatus Thiosymbion oneisti]|uniref:lytic murein transglycosylase B n=1 Tax=Candidatus Thiosymbion oneisti TaxID=589554 RepID=UPI000AF9BA64|nr:lytic murein transglycosylase B [Candidatus Thiosymbion oneisti]